MAEGPLVPASRSLPELTVKSMVLGILLSMILAAANAYLGLRVGMTVSAAIPASVMSMAVLRCFRRSNILETNAAQVSASSGEAVAAGAIFTLPALVMLGAWSGFGYVQTTIIAALGGLIGVLFSIPLRRALIVEAKLRFPEGVATAEVLKTGGIARGPEETPAARSDPLQRVPAADRARTAEQNSGVAVTTHAPSAGSGSGIGYLLLGAAVGAVLKLCQLGLHLWGESFQLATRAGRWLLYGGTDLAPALVGVGYIVGLNIAVLIFAGGAIAWLGGIPLYTSLVGWPASQTGDALAAADAAGFIWSTQIRYVGVGAMIVGGLWTLLRLGRPVMEGVRRSLEAYRTLRRARAGHAATAQPERTEFDTPVSILLPLLGVAAIPLAVLYTHVTGNIGIALLMTLLMLAAGFVFSAVAAYMAGLVGSSSNPISGVTLATLLVSSLLLVALMGEGNSPADGAGSPPSARGPAAAILIAAVVCCAAAISGDNMQDLKTSHILGATPWKSQVAQTLGTLAGALVVAPVLQLLLTAYGIGEVRVEGRDPLTAPQATLMMSVASGVFGGTLNWTMILIGIAVGAAIIVADVVLERRAASFRMPVLAVAVGIYLPMELSVPIFLGGLLAHFAARARKSAEGRPGTLLAAGLITGDALMGILLAIPIALGVAEQFHVFEDPSGVLGLPMLAFGAAVLYWAASRR